MALPCMVQVRDCHTANRTYLWKMKSLLTVAVIYITGCACVARAQVYGGCDLNALMQDVRPIEGACCGPSACMDGPPATCSETCAPIFGDFMTRHRTCESMLVTILGDLESKCDAVRDSGTHGAVTVDCSTAAVMPIVMLCAEVRRCLT